MLKSISKTCPEDWETKKVTELIEFVSRGKSPKYTDNSGFKVINQKCIYWDTLNLDNAKFVEESTKEKWKEELFVRQGDVLLNSTGTGTIGRANVINHNLENYVIDSHVTLIRTNKELLNPFYFKNYLEFYPNQQKLAALCFTGSTNQVELSKTQLLDFPLLTPPIKEQNKIAAILSSVDNAIEKTEEIIGQSEKVKKGLMQQLLTKGIRDASLKETKYGIVPDDWEIKTVKDIAIKVTDGEHKTPKRSSSGFLLLSARNVKNGTLNLINVDYVEQEEFSKITKRCHPEHGDILISCSGTIGNICVVPKDLDFALVRSVALVKPDRRQVDSDYLMYVLQSPKLQSQMRMNLSQLAQANLFLRDINRLTIPLPTLEEQKKIVSILNEVSKKRNKEKEVLETLITLKKGLMQDLLTGKVRVNVDEEEVVSS
ncbi:restriction endonuclease subunit S [Guptibacillus hwajinpoensis]|uniref:restriction endonuclease subunit S n=1 Tax=Guptibacillus hwajinpoensis TaxID=208199 RepID=UPI003735BACB